MATFQYIAKDASGNETRGTVEAGDRSSAIAAVRAQGLMPTALGEGARRGEERRAGSGRGAGARQGGEETSRKEGRRPQQEH